MSDFIQRHFKTIFIGATILYVLSMGLWVMWPILLFFGAGYGSEALTLLSFLAALLYPILIVVSLVIGWRFQASNQFKKATWAIVTPLLYFPIMIIIGSIAINEGM